MLLESDGSVVIQVSVQVVAEQLHGVPPRSVPFGRYWWLNDEAHPAVSFGGEDIHEPF